MFYARRVAVQIFLSAPLPMLCERAYLIKCMMSLGHSGAIQFFLYSSIRIDLKLYEAQQPFASQLQASELPLILTAASRPLTFAIRQAQIAYSSKLTLANRLIHSEMVASSGRQSW